MNYYLRNLTFFSKCKCNLNFNFKLWCCVRSTVFSAIYTIVSWKMQNFPICQFTSRIQILLRKIIFDSKNTRVYRMCAKRTKKKKTHVVVKTDRFSSIIRNPKRKRYDT